MNFLEARAKLEELAGKDRYRSLSYEVTEDKHGIVEVKCWVYVADKIGFAAPTWEEALLELEYELYPDRKPAVVIDNFEEIENGN